VRTHLLLDELPRGVPQLLVLGLEYQSLHVSLLLGFPDGCRFSAKAVALPCILGSDQRPDLRAWSRPAGFLRRDDAIVDAVGHRLLAHTASGALTVIRSASVSAASTAVPSGTT